MERSIRRRPVSASCARSSKWLSARSTATIIVDADDLLADLPILAAYCAAIDVPFDEGLLTWKAGPVTEFKTWSAWHTDAENSTGFVDKGGRGGRGAEVESTLPDEVEAAIAACLPDYESLYARRIGAR